MTTPNPTIFRTEALQYRIQHQGRRRPDLSLPRLMTRPVLMALWLVLVLLGAGGGAACFASVPVSESGLAIVMTSAAQSEAATSVAVLIPQEFEHRLRPGQDAKVFLNPNASDSGISGTVAAIEQDALDPLAAGQRLGLPGPVQAMLDGPVVVVWVSIDGPPDGAGTVGRADLPIGSRQAGTFLPLVGRFFED